MSAIVDAHCHLWIEPPPGVVGPRLADERATVEELRAFADVGGVGVIDCQPGGCGRDGRVLARVAAGSGVEVAPATGYHLARYYSGPSSPYGVDPAECVDRWERELRDGLAEQPRLRARVVKSAWTGGGRDEDELLAAAAEVARRHGVPLIVHTERGAAVEALAERLAAIGPAPERVQLSHVDKRPDPGLHRELASAGFMLGYDTFLRPRYRPEDNLWPLLVELASEGLWERITVGLDLVAAEHWSVGGGDGLPAIGRTIRPRLVGELGGEAAAAMTGGNALRMLAPVGAPR